MKRARKPSWSFVVMRGADKTVKQFSVSKRSVVAVPAAALLAVSGTIAGLQMKAAYELKHLEEQLREQSAAYTQTIADLDNVIDNKDGMIVSLRKEVFDLSRQAKEIGQKLLELQTLEQKLKTFIEKYGSSIGEKAALSTPPADKAAGPFFQTLSAPKAVRLPVSATAPVPLGNMLEVASLAHTTSIDLTALGDMIDSMELSMEQTLRQARQTRSTVDAYPNYWPTRSRQMTSGFGYRRDPITGATAFHAGIDINGKTGDAVFSAADGTVEEVGFNRQYGHFIVIGHLGGLQTAYMHLKQADASEGDIVVRGEKIGQLGSSGRSTGPHLHFQIMQKNEPVNPMKYLARQG